MKTKLTRQALLDAADRARARVSKMSPVEREVLKARGQQMLRVARGFPS